MKQKLSSLTFFVLLIAARVCLCADGKDESEPAALATTIPPEVVFQDSVVGPYAMEAIPPPVWISKVPQLQLPRQRSGFFTIAPSGPGYYSMADALTGNMQSAPPKIPYPAISSNPYPFFDADFRFLDAPGAKSGDMFDALKRMRVGNDWLLSLGGEERLRYMNALDDARLNGVQSSFLLYRTRLYGDLWYQDQFRVYAEGIDAHTTPQGQAPLAIDVNAMDIWNLFIDYKVASVNDQPIYLRAGRQELYFGSQRLISPSDWSNIPRTFQGLRAMYQTERWNLDAFWVHPVLIRPTQLDLPELQQNFAGFWSTYRPADHQTMDFYYLYLDQSQAVAVGQSNVSGGYRENTIGTRYSGDKNDWLWDFEAMYQFGNWSNQSIAAEAATGGLGYRFADLPMTPNLWGFVDYASGDPHPGSGGTHRTFNQLFPWGHTYFGYLDLVGRQNIIDPNLQLTLTPTPWIITGLQSHFFYLASARDALYNSSGTVLAIDPTGRSGTHVGNEIDLYANFHVSKRQDVLLGYSHLFIGEFLESTGTTKAPNLFYAQYSFKW